MNQYDRNEIARLVKDGSTQQQIADRLGFSKSAICQELQRNSRSVKTRYGKPCNYEPLVAHQKTYVRRKYAKYQGMKIVGCPTLREFIDQSLLNYQTPSAISGRLKTGREGLPYVSRSAIEKYLDSPYAAEVRCKLDQFRRQFRRRKKRPRVDKLANRTFIDERPNVITKRERIGDIEIDFMLSGRGGEGYLLTAVDRRGRKSFVRTLLPVTIANLTRLLLEIKQEFPELKSITTDNDILLSQHNLLSSMLDVPIYFCHPCRSWEKGSIENLIYKQNRGGF
jgi:IS30 family transposase